IDETYNIKKDETIESVIDKLKKCATCYNDELKTDNKTIILDYFVSEATHKAFKHHFESASKLYGIFYLLNSLNAYAIPSYQRKRIMKSKSASTLAGIIPKTTDDNLVFRIENILLCKNGVKEPIHYRKFSDGEHQLMQTIGAVLLIDEPGTLFLMDEPETHFNPQWRSKFVSTLNKITENEAAGRQQELILTTHSPFILSDCQTHNVFKFERKDGIVKAENPKVHTYGTSFSILYKEIFDKENTISDLAAENIERLKNESIETSEDIERIKDEVLELGESAEKFFLLSYLNKKEKQINSKGDDK
ncbi:MAG: restriction system-associated AAA family ATPase, partial [Clostridiaceae bacterium]|nr:restriction system-associated AAA family ATPase [Clostridiaceae bacterium]